MNMSDQTQDDQTKNRIIQTFKEARRKALVKRKGERQDENTETHIKISIEKLSLEISTKRGKKKPII
jgi:hypothetical protein